MKKLIFGDVEFFLNELEVGIDFPQGQDHHDIRFLSEDDGRALFEWLKQIYE